jgi:hypothetical protein
VGQGQPVGDGGVVAANAAGKGMQVEQVVGIDGGDPAGQRVDRWPPR